MEMLVRGEAFRLGLGQGGEVDPSYAQDLACDMEVVRSDDLSWGDLLLGNLRGEQVLVFLPLAGPAFVYTRARV
jgi:hypothetical protein